MGDLSFGIDVAKVHRSEKCWAREQTKYLKENNLFEGKRAISDCIRTLIKNKTPPADAPAACGTKL